MEAIRVLLAEDHAVLREATAEIVNHQSDMRVVAQAGTGEEAVRLASAVHDDVVRLEIAMHDSGAMRMIERVRDFCAQLGCLLGRWSLGG